VTPCVMFYVQHLLGIGHVVRALRIARAMQATRIDVRLVMGGVPVQGMDISDLPVHQLPPVQSGPEGFSDLVDGDGNPVDQAFWARRRDELLKFFADVTPDALLIEAYPFGRRQMRFELLPLLEQARQAQPRPLIAVSIRDILQENRKRKRLEETVSILNRFFDIVLVHGDRRYNTIADTFPVADRIEPPIVYTGIVAGPPPPPAREQFDVIVSTGGGAVGEDLLRASLDARPTTSFANARWLFLTGPNLSDRVFEALKDRHAGEFVHIERFRNDLNSLFVNACLSVSQCGYNTMADIVQTGCASVVIPFAASGESEQTRRGEALQARGRVVMVRESDLSASSLAQAIDRAAAQSSGRTIDIDIDGAPTTARILHEKIGNRISPPTP